MLFLSTALIRINDNFKLKSSPSPQNHLGLDGLRLDTLKFNYPNIFNLSLSFTGWDLYPESETYQTNRNNNPYGRYPPDSLAPDNNRFGQYGNNYVDRFNTFSSPYQVNNPQIEKRPPPSEVLPIPAGTLERAEFGLLTPTLPPLPGGPTDRVDRSRTEETDASLRIGTSAVTDSTTINNSLPTTTMEPELREEPIDEFFGKLDQDPFEAQRQAIMAIETCYMDQKMEIQRNRDAELYLNTSEEYEANETSAQTGKHGSIGRDTRYVPGSLLSCVHKAVQQRCHSGAGTSSFTGRYACEAVCEVVRERMAQLVQKLDDCKQPLSSCTERFVAFHVTPTWPPLPTQITSQSQPIGSSQTESGASSPASARSSASIRGKKRDQGVQPYLAQGDYCHECGTRRWYLRPISGTNLFFLVDITLPGGSSGGCECRCMKRFRYGAQISNILFDVPRVNQNDSFCYCDRE
ncbi:hypothetical protein FGIG_03575 [Fasciola gigantica]|uniref:Uncharacterized protein n=1 Tax=Fasciola gigantica TaxID=46835 RepID=A0A504YHW6_FASGI|nr:hypothetical protein FGIG_03575 [Fasciola gigantica]